jgi:hypothetical protein
LRGFKSYVRKRTQRKSVFKRDRPSSVFEAYLLNSLPPGAPSQGLFSSSTAAPPPIKLPFGHRRLNRQIKQALRSCNPWDVLLLLRPNDRVRVDQVAKQVQLEASGNMSVCLVAIQVEGWTDADLVDLDSDFISWTRMVLFFRLEPIYAGGDTAEHEQQVVAGQPRFTTNVWNMFRSSQRRNIKHKELQAKLKREKQERLEQEAKNEADRQNIAKVKAEMEEDKKGLEAEMTRIEQEKKDLEGEKTRIASERDAVESKNRALKNAEQAVLRSIERGTAETELKRVFEEERIKRMVEEEHMKKKKDLELSQRRQQEERAKKLAMEREAAEKAAYEEEKAAKEKAKPPIKFKDAVGRKFNFPFHLVQTWEVSRLVPTIFVPSPQPWATILVCLD